MKHAWCGLPVRDHRVDRSVPHFLGDWGSENGPIAYCCGECRDARKRVGSHIIEVRDTKLFGKVVYTGNNDDLTTEKLYALISKSKG